MSQGRTGVRDTQGERIPGSGASATARKAHALAQHTASIVRSIADAVVIKEAEPFFLCPPDGQILASGDHGFGLYHHDTRFLAGYELQIAGATPNSLAATALAGGRAVIELTMPAIDLGDGRTIAKERLAVRWDRVLDGEAVELRDRITLRNFDTNRARLPIRLAFGADFNDVFAVRGLVAERPGRLLDSDWDGDRLTFGYDGADGVKRRLEISFSHALDARSGTACTLALDVPARGTAYFEVSVAIHEEIEPGAAPIERRTRKASHERREAEQPDSRTGETSWSGGAGWPVSVNSDSPLLNAALSRSLDDLLTLRGELDGQRYYSAGVPWFSTLFGRDALISAYQTLAFDRDVAAETLRLLAGRQGTKVDDWRDEEPGKILHELRIGELARLHEIPHTPYFGSIDATLLFLIVLAAHARWAGALDLFHELRPNVDRALDWLDTFALPAGDGFAAYDSSTDHGLINQGWKDSGDAIVTAAGRIADPPIALAELQGYAFAAWTGIAGLLEREGEADRARELTDKARAIQERFERRFWSDELESYVLALARDGAPCSVVTSNAGQVLWSGIASPGHAKRVAGRLLEDDMFSGWGIRTLSSRARSFNPIGYHLGTVWPHDNGIIADGFRRYGLDDMAERLLVALVEASADFPQQRLPECFAGFARAEFGVPVRYPIACHPQAWAAGTVPHLLTSTLGLVPDGFDHRLTIQRPRLPSFLEHLTLARLDVAGSKVDLRFERSADRTGVTIERVDGPLDVRIEDA